MSTPESKIKVAIKQVLREQEVYFFMPVQMGYGPAGLDFHCVVITKTSYPLPFFIEAKAGGKKATLRQEETIEKLRKKYNCKVWVIDSELDVKALELWLQTIRGI